MKAWWNETAWPWLHSNSVAIAQQWWGDIGDHPKMHFVSMVVGMVLYIVVKFAVKLAA